MPTKARKIVKSVTIACDVRDTLPLGDLIDLQGDLKELGPEERADLRAQILETGFAFPLYVWKDPKSKKCYICGGHQRKKVLADLRDDGYDIPQVPVVYVHAANLEEAKVRALQDISQYGKVVPQALFDFSKAAKIDVSKIARFKIPEIDRSAFIRTFFPKSVAPGKRRKSLVDDFYTQGNNFVDIDKLKLHPDSYRKNPDDQVGHIAEALDQFGIYRNIVTANDYTILTGQGIYEAAKKRRLKNLPVKVMDYGPDDPQALKILLNDNELGHLSEVDDRKLSELLKKIKDTSPTGLAGTGYDEKMLAALLMVTRPASEIADVNEAAHWVGMPEFENVQQPFKIIVQVADEGEAAKFLALTKVKTVTKGKNTWSFHWPERERRDMSSVKFTAKKK